MKITDICRKAGRSVGAFYYYFPTKDSIINEGYREMDQSLQEFWMHFTRTGSTDDILSFVLREAEILQERGYRIDTQLFKSQLTSEDKYILNKSRFSYRAILGMVRRLTNGGQLRSDPDEITRFIFLTTRGTLYDWCMHEGQYDLCDMFRKAVGIVLSFYFGSR